MFKKIPKKFEFFCQKFEKNIYRKITITQKLRVVDLQKYI